MKIPPRKTSPHSGTRMKTSVPVTSPRRRTSRKSSGCDAHGRLFASGGKRPARTGANHGSTHPEGNSELLGDGDVRSLWTHRYGYLDRLALRLVLEGTRPRARRLPPRPLVAPCEKSAQIGAEPRIPKLSREVPLEGTADHIYSDGNKSPIIVTPFRLPPIRHDPI